MKDNVTVTKAAHVKRFGLDDKYKTMQSDLPRPSDEF